MNSRYLAEPQAGGVSILPEIGLPKLGLRTKLLFGTGGAAYGVKDAGFTYFVLLFYNQVLGLPASAVGTALMIALVIDAFADVSIARASDQLRSRWGRRHPFMYAAAAPLAIAYLLLWHPPQGVSDAVLFVYLLCMSIAVRTCFALYEVPSAALIPELTTDYNERTTFISIRVFMGLLGGFLAAAITYGVFLRPDATYVVGQLNPSGYAKMGAAGALAMFVVILLSALATHRFIPMLRQPAPDSRVGIAALLHAFGTTLSNRSLRVLLISGMCSALAQGLVSSLSIYILTYFWHLTPGQTAVLTISLLLGGFVAFVVAPALARRFGKRETGIAAGLIGILFASGPIVLKLGGAVFATPLLLPLLIITHAVSIACSTSGVIMIGSMLADVVDDHEVATGQRAEGVMVAVNLFVSKAISGVGVFASGLVLSLAAFPQHATPDSAAPAVERLASFIVIGQSLFALLAVAMLSRYRIGRKQHEANLETLRRRAARGGARVADDTQGRAQLAVAREAHE